MGRVGREEWAKRIERWKESGLTAAEFAREIGVSEKSVRWWKWQLAGKATKAPRGSKAKTAMSPLTFMEVSSVQSAAIEVVLANGIRVRLAHLEDAVVFVRLLEGVDGRK